MILSGTHAPFHNSTAFKNKFKDALMYLVNVGVDCTTICHNLVTLQQYFSVLLLYIQLGIGDCNSFY